MALGATFRRKIAVLVENAADSPGNRARVAAHARESLAQLIQAGQASPAYARFVDGHADAAEETVKLDGGTIAAPASYLLDTLTASAAGAYGLRKLRAGYTGPAIRVRRSDTNVETDVGFDGSGNLSAPGLASAAGGASGFVSKWYDQSPAALHLAQSTASNQPRIVNAGTVDKLGNATARPGLYFGGGPYLVNSPGITGGKISAFAVAQEPSGTNQNRLLTYSADAGYADYDTNDKVILMIFDGGGKLFSFANGGYLSKATYSTAPFQASTVLDGTNATTTVDGATLGSGSSSNINLIARSFLVGTGTNAFTGYASEVLLFGASVPTTADIATIRASQRTYFGTP